MVLADSIVRRRCGTVDTRGGHLVDDQPRQLERDPENKIFAGVAAGFANYVKTDPTMGRVLGAVELLAGGLGFFV